MLPNLIRNTLAVVADVDLLDENGLPHIRITVDASPYPVNYKGEYHYRSGSTKQELKGNALSRFLLKKTGLSWDAAVIDNTDISTFRNDAFDIFREQARLSARMAEKDVAVSNEMLAEKLDLLSDDNVTRAGVLLFHHNPEKWVTDAWIKIILFADDATILFQAEIHGALLQQADRIMDLFYTKYLTAPISFKGITRVEKYPYSKDAV